MQSVVLLCRSTIQNLMLGEAYRLFSQERVRFLPPGSFTYPLRHAAEAAILLFRQVDGMPSHSGRLGLPALVGLLFHKSCCDT